MLQPRRGAAVVLEQVQAQYAQSAKPQFMTGDYIPYSPTRSGVALRMRSCRQLPSPFASPFEADIRSNARSALRISSPIQALLSQFAPVSNVFEFPTFRTKSRKPASDEQNSPIAISSLSLSQRDVRRRRLQKLTSPPRCARARPSDPESDAGSKVGDWGVPCSLLPAKQKVTKPFALKAKGRADRQFQ